MSNTISQDLTDDIVDVMKQSITDASERIGVFCQSPRKEGGTWHSFERWLTWELFYTFQIQRRHAYCVFPEPMYLSYTVSKDTAPAKDDSRADLIIADQKDPHEWGIIVEVKLAVHRQSGDNNIPDVAGDATKWEKRKPKQVTDWKDDQGQWKEINEFAFMQVLVDVYENDGIEPVGVWRETGWNIIQVCSKPKVDLCVHML